MGAWVSSGSAASTATGGVEVAGEKEKLAISAGPPMPEALCNFDFEGRWETEVAPILRRAGRETIETLLFAVHMQSHWSYDTYHMSYPPAGRWVNNSSYCELLDKVYDKHLESFESFKALLDSTENPLLVPPFNPGPPPQFVPAQSPKEQPKEAAPPKIETQAQRKADWLRAYQQWSLWDEVDIVETDLEDEYTYAKRPMEACVLRALGMDFLQRQDHLACYASTFCCEEFNSIFGLWLARQVLPAYNWQVLKQPGSVYATVYSAEHNLLFDLVAWGQEGRWERFMRVPRRRPPPVPMDPNPDNGASWAWHHLHQTALNRNPSSATQPLK